MWEDDWKEEKVKIKNKQAIVSIVDKVNKSNK